MHLKLQKPLVERLRNWIEFNPTLEPLWITSISSRNGKNLFETLFFTRWNRSAIVHRLKGSMERKEYSTAAECISKFRALEKEIKQPPEPHQKEVDWIFCL